ncbi:MAG: alpha-xylosidase, partial [Clostridiales bacterium]|nr:alpha-xylosidase [Clostridiales bacterium]
NTSTADVYKRWVAFGLLSSHSRLHGSTSYRVPWAYDEESVDVVRFFTRLKARLMPYIFKIAIDTSITGIPTMRSMVLEYTEDKTCHYVDKQYMLGDCLLVAPIFNEESLAEYYLPEGTWTNFFTGEIKTGPAWIAETHDYMSLPLMVKENSIVALGHTDNGPDYDYGEHPELRIYALKEEKEASTVVYNTKGTEVLEIRVLKAGNTVKVSVTSSGPCTLRFINMKGISSSEGTLWQEGPDTLIVLTEHGNRELIITL